MPWTGKTFRSRHNKSLTPEQAGAASRVANAVLRDTGDEGKAIRIANAQANRGRQHVMMPRARGRGR